jgi:hypothetical protein
LSKFSIVAGRTLTQFRGEVELHPHQCPIRPCPLHPQPITDLDNDVIQITL